VKATETTPPRDRSGRPTTEVPTHVSPQEAAALCRVSIDTIRRRIKAGAIPGATRQGELLSDPWSLPIEGLVSSGLCSREDLRELAASLPPDVEELQAKVVALESQLEAARGREAHQAELLDRANADLAYLRGIVDRLLDGPALARSA
jgi:hypothetical protein